MKKIIDIPENVHKALSHQAIDKRMSLKKYIEQLLIDKANEGNTPTGIR
jgi:predicted HicB family RNase H-like nuclease